MDLTSADPDHATNSDWIASGNLQIVTGPSSEPTTGKITSYSGEPFVQSTSSLFVKEGGVVITTKAATKLRVESEVICGGGSKKQVVWLQDLAFSTTQRFSKDALIQVLHYVYPDIESVTDTSPHSKRVAKTSSGTSSSTKNGLTKTIDQFSYPLYVNFTALTLGPTLVSQS